MHRALLASVVSSVLLLTGAASAQDVGQSQEPICCGAECCLIGADCLQRGDLNPANECEMCDPGVSQTAFTPVEGGSCAAPDSGPAPTPDAGSGGGGGGGCSAAASPAGPLGALLPLLALGLLIRRRR